MHQDYESSVKVKIAPQAWRFVFMGAAADAAGLALVVAGTLHRIPAAAVAGAFCCALATLFTAFCLYFFRDPERPLPTDMGKIYSPGDGVVMSAGREGPGDVVTLRIFLSVFDVHLQRNPCSGRVEKTQHIPGSFVAAMKDDAKANERSVVTIIPQGRKDPLVVEQIAGLIARRIETWVKAGDVVKAGARYGIIYFGSQAAVHFPASARCLVKPGDRVVGGVTPIGEWL